MSRKKTIEEVREYVESQGFELLSDEYENSYTKLKLKCSEGHECKVCWDNFKGPNGQRCKICNIIKKRISIKEIKKYVEKFDGYILISEEFDPKKKLEIRCPKGHEYVVNWDNFKGGQRCPFCYYNSKTKSIEEIKKYVEKFGYELLSKLYNPREKLKIKRCKNHYYEAHWYSFQSGQRCPFCYGKRRKNIEEIKKYVEKFGYEVLTNKYKNSRTKLKFKCIKGHIYISTWDSFKQGARCMVCSGKRKIIEDIRDYLKNLNYELLSKEYKNANTKLKIKCSDNHIFEKVWGDIQQGSDKCPICSYLRRSGPGNPLWKGGISFEPYPIIFNNSLKKKIKKRDNYKCMNPLCSNKHSVLHIHHIDYVKENCSIKNLITICCSCNGRANVKRDWWTEFYQNLLHEKYGYIYENIEEEKNKCLEIQ